MEWKDIIKRKRELLNKATSIMLTRSRIDAVELSKNLGVDVNTFVIFLSEDLINIAKSRGFNVIYGSYDPETGAIRDRVIRDGKSIIIPIFIRK